MPVFSTHFGPLWGIPGGVILDSGGDEQERREAIEVTEDGIIDVVARVRERYDAPLCTADNRPRHI
jgi:hypothetical protein